MQQETSLFRNQQKTQQLLNLWVKRWTPQPREFIVFRRQSSSSPLQTTTTTKTVPLYDLAIRSKTAELWRKKGGKRFFQLSKKSRLGGQKSGVGGISSSPFLFQIAFAITRLSKSRREKEKRLPLLSLFDHFQTRRL